MFFWELTNRTSLTSLSSLLARSLISLPIYYPPIFYLTLFLIAQDDGTDIEFRNVGFYTSNAGEVPKRTQTTWRVLFQNKINLRYCASGWFYYRNILRSAGLQTSNVMLHFRFCLNSTDGDKWFWTTYIDMSTVLAKMLIVWFPGKYIFLRMSVMKVLFFF